MTDDIIELAHVEMRKNDYGVDERLEIKRPVFAQIKSVTQTEFFKAMQTNLQAEYVFCIFSGEYHNEEVAFYHGRKYAIYRVYVKGDTTELYVESRSGYGAKLG